MVIVGPSGAGEVEGIGRVEGDMKGEEWEVGRCIKCEGSETTRLANQVFLSGMKPSATIAAQIVNATTPVITTI